MTGATIELEFDSQEAQAVINRRVANLEDLTPSLKSIGEYLLIAHYQRFRQQVAPDGTPWAHLKPSYQRRKKKNANRILFLDGYLSNTFRYQVGNNELRFGSDRPYAAIHQFGGEITKKLTGKKSKAKAAQGAPATAIIKITARPFLGTSEADNREILEILSEDLGRD